jgi:hypothetical protein
MTTITEVLDVIVDDSWPAADEETATEVLPIQVNEFICSCCFLIHHRSQLAGGRRGQRICRDCA